MTISVIIPIFNEEEMLPAFLNQTANWLVHEIILVDGNSNDQTQGILESFHRNPLLCPLPQGVRKAMIGHRLLVAKKGRGNQMNEGAKVATGDVLLFLHADSIFPSDGFFEISKAMQNTHLVGGAFRLKIQSTSLFFKFISMMANIRSSIFGLPYGDQGIFVRREIFSKIGGYPDFPLMEDAEFIRQLKHEGMIILLDQAVTTSARKWHKQGIVFTSLRNIILLLLYFMGVSPKQLVKWYD
ncbi:MAG: TIGR04283 family arsenosugar biosynthesis glycosyltransferase [Nitrospirae bacterium]|nr:TIGR04283 family arsenosugar biosynthesis glycosyltransferase [Candidatus Troglogloeales bacterium]